MDREILEYDFDYHTTQEIKHIIIGVQELKVRRDVEREYFHNKRNPQVDYLAHAKQSAKHEPLDYISDFIIIKEINDGFYIEAELYLPYVRDSEMNILENHKEYWRKRCCEHELKIMGLCDEVKQLRRPWWKKLFRIEK